MEMKSMAKDLIGLQKQATNNCFDAITLFQDQAEITNRFFTKQIRLDDNVQDYIDQWRSILKDGRDEYRKLVIESITNMEDYLDGFGNKK
jgi:hypothetical protein